MQRSGHSIQRFPPTFTTSRATRTKLNHNCLNFVRRPLRRFRAFLLPVLRYIISFMYCHADPPVHGIDAHNVIFDEPYLFTALSTLSTLADFVMSSFSVSLITSQPSVLGPFWPKVLFSEQQNSISNRLTLKSLLDPAILADFCTGTNLSFNGVLKVVCPDQS